MASKPVTSMTLERFAELLALTKHFPADASEALLRSHVEPKEFSDAEKVWMSVMVASVTREETGELQTFGARFAEERARLRKVDPTLESLGPLPAIPKADEEVPHTIRNRAPVQDVWASPLPAVDVANAPERMPAVEVPSYLVKPESAQMTAASVGRTETSNAPPNARPSKADVTPASKRRPRAPFQPIATEELPRPEEIERLIRESDPRGAMSRAARAEPKTAPSAEPSRSGRNPNRSSPDADETLMVRSPFLTTPVATGSFRDALTPVVVPTLSIPEYARFRAALRVHGEEHERTFRLFGVASVAVRNTLQSQFALRFQSDPAAQAEYLKLFEKFLRALNEGDP